MSVSGRVDEPAARPGRVEDGLRQARHLAAHGHGLPRVGVQRESSLSSSNLVKRSCHASRRSAPRRRPRRRWSPRVAQHEALALRPKQAKLSLRPRGAAQEIVAPPSSRPSRRARYVRAWPPGASGGCRPTSGAASCSASAWRCWGSGPRPGVGHRAGQGRGHLQGPALPLLPDQEPLRRRGAGQARAERRAADAGRGRRPVAWLDSALDAVLARRGAGGRVRGDRARPGRR